MNHKSVELTLVRQEARKSEEVTDPATFCQPCGFTQRMVIVSVDMGDYRHRYCGCPRCGHHFPHSSVIASKPQFGIIFIESR